MSEPIYVTQGKLIADTSLIPYIRRQKIYFDADNLRPYKRASIFFDEIVVNHLTQRGNIIEVNARKQVVLSTTGSYSAVTTDIAWQGSAFSSKTFSGVVQSYDSSTKTLVLNDLSGAFDEDAPIYISNSTGLTLKLTATIVSSLSQNNVSAFSQEEEVYVERTGAYMEVVATSGENILYMSENYIHCNVIALSTTLPTSAYQDGDLVFQTKEGVNNYDRATFIGRVKYSRPQASANVISIEPISGVLRVNSDSANVRITMFNESNTSAPAVKVLNTRLNDCTANDYLVSISTGKKLQVTRREHYSGVISNNALSFNGLSGPAGSIVQLSANVSADVDGKILYITSGRGMGQARRIIEVLQNAVKLNTALDGVGLSSTTHYTIGNHVVDENGSIGGIFNLPEETSFKFKSGERVFTITDTDKVDNPNYTMKAAAKFTASGLLNITQRITSTPINTPLPEFSAENPVAPTAPTQGGDQTSSPILGSSNIDSVPRIGFVNGLSQTFFTPKPASNKIDRGFFITSVDLFFKAKPNKARGSMQLPVSVRIAKVVNGYPTKQYLGYSKLPPNEVKIAGGVSKYPDVNNEQSKTKFVFKDPIYLEPNNEYAITIGSESPEYELWIAELGQEVLNSNPPRRISEQPYAGSLFKSQNSSTWTAYQNQDLMFVLNKASFTSSGGAVYFKLKDPPKINMDISKLILHTNDLAFTSAIVDYGVKSYRRNISSGVPSEESNYTDLKAHKYLRYGELDDKDATFTNTRYLKKGDRNSIILRADIVSSDTDISPMINKETISVAVKGYKINDAGISNNVVSIATKGLGYKADPKGNLVGTTDASMNTAATNFRNTFYGGNINVAMYSISVISPVGSGAKGFAVANTDGTNRIDRVIITNEGSGYYETPEIRLAAPIDASPQEEALIIARGETDSWGGNILTRYQTRQISLLEGFEAGDLIIFMDAIRPVGTDIQVYYKVLGVDDPERFYEKTWVRMNRRADIFSKDSNTIREFEYRPSFDKNELSYIYRGTEYPIGKVFKSFAVKVCLTSNDKAVVPYIRNIRISAVPAG